MQAAIRWQVVARRMSAFDPLRTPTSHVTIGPMTLLLSRLPELVADLPRMVPEGKLAFDARVRGRFPPGTVEEILKEELVRQGFKLLPGNPQVHDATLYRGWIVRAMWSVRWKSQNGRITDLWGVFGYKAP